MSCLILGEYSKSSDFHLSQSLDEMYDAFLNKRHIDRWCCSPENLQWVEQFINGSALFCKGQYQVGAHQILGLAIC